MGHETRPALLVGSGAGFDIEPRGVMAIDAVSGEVLWRYQVGPSPSAESFKMADLDGEGIPEIILFGRGVGNTREQEFDGTRDDRAMLFVVRPDGTLR